jgi:hypothetical protein
MLTTMPGISLAGTGAKWKTLINMPQIVDTNRGYFSFSGREVRRHG